MVSVLLDRFHFAKSSDGRLFSHVRHVSECFSNCNTPRPTVWYQLLTTLSLSSLPFPPPYRKAETESGKLVTVKKKKKNTHSAHSPDLCCCHQEVPATTSFDRKLQPHITPKTRGTSALLKYTVSHHQHICHAKVPRRHPATSC